MNESQDYVEWKTEQLKEYVLFGSTYVLFGSTYKVPELATLVTSNRSQNTGSQLEEGEGWRLVARQGLQGIFWSN